MLPFLKEQHEGGTSGPVENLSRDSDEGSFGMLDAIVDDLLEALNRKDKKLLKDTLQALIEHIQDQDEIQDSEEI